MPPTLSRRTLLAGAAACSTLGLAGAARAQDRFPSRPVRIIVGLPAGGVADHSVRLLTARLQLRFGQPLIVENRAGASFQLAVHAVTQAPADGHTLLYLISAMLSAQAVHKRYDVFKSLVPVMGLGSTDTTFAVGARSPHKTVQELIAWARAHPGRLSFGSPGMGSLEHVALAGFMRRYDIDAVHVPFKGGPEVMQALATGQIDLGTQAVPAVAQHARTGLIRALVVLNHRRNTAVADVPTLKEAGLDIGRLTLWGGFAAPVGTPREVLGVLEAAFMAAARDAAFVQQFHAMGVDPHVQTAAEFGQHWKDDWGWISKSATENRIELN